MVKRCDLFFEGGGVRAMALLGVASVLEEEGYQFERLGGTSSGAILAALLAAGYTTDELHDIFLHLDFRKFRDFKSLTGIQRMRQLGRRVAGFGLHEGRTLERFIEDLLKEKGVHRFKDPRVRGRLVVTVTDVTLREGLLIPNHMAKLGAELSVACAVRASCAIPFFFEPVTCDGHVLVDGGVGSAFPLWIFDRPDPRWPTFGLRPHPKPSSKPVDSLRAYLTGVVDTLFESRNLRELAAADEARTISVPLATHPTDFAISLEQKRRLFAAGRRAAWRFLKGWSFAHYKKHYRA